LRETHGCWCLRSNTTNFRGCVKNPESHPRQWVDISGPAYRGAHPRVPVFILFLANARKREEKKNNREAAALSCMLDLKYPPTAVGGISGFYTVSEARWYLGAGRHVFRSKVKLHRLKPDGISEAAARCYVSIG